MVVLRAAAGLLLLAAPFTLLPQETMAALHARLGLGELPALPIVGYLTRSVSALYAFYGLIVLVVSFDVRRYGPLITVLGLGSIGFGAFMLVVDRFVQMPRAWVLIEGPFTIVVGTLILVLQQRGKLPNDHAEPTDK